MDGSLCVCVAFKAKQLKAAHLRKTTCLYLEKHINNFTTTTATITDPMLFFCSTMFCYHLSSAFWVLTSHQKNNPERELFIMQSTYIRFRILAAFLLYFKNSHLKTQTELQNTQNSGQPKRMPIVGRQSIRDYEYASGRWSTNETSSTCNSALNTMFREAQ